MTRHVGQRFANASTQIAVCQAGWPAIIAGLGLECFLFKAPVPDDINADLSLVVESDFVGYARQAVSLSGGVSFANDRALQRFNDHTFAAGAGVVAQLAYGYGFVYAGFALSNGLCVQSFDSPVWMLANGDTLTIHRPGLWVGPADVICDGIEGTHV